MGPPLAGAQDGFEGDGPKPIKLDPNRYVPALVTALSGALTTHASIFYRQNFGVGVTDWRIMYRLSSEPWITARRICAISDLNKAVVSRSIAWMESRGLVLVRSDTKDGRQRLLALSPVGIDLYERITVVALARERNFLAGLTADEVTETIRLLTKLVGNLDAFSQPVNIPPPKIAPDADARPMAPRRPSKARA